MAEQHPDPLWIEHGYGTRFQGFQNLMRRRIRDILLVSSLYDLYLFEEDGRLCELIRNDYQRLHLIHSPEMTRVSSGMEALALAKEERRFDLIIATMHIEDMTPLKLASKVREAGLDLPVVLLAHDNGELTDILTHHDTSAFAGVFIWLGDFRLIIGIVKYLEDRMNVDHDTRLVGVQSIILIEDDVRYYSSFLPIIYAEILDQSQRLISEGINLSHGDLRTRARPKILLCTSYEQAWDYYDKYEDFILGIISDIDFPRNGEPDPRAGLKFCRAVRKRNPDLPILFHSTTKEHAADVRRLGASFVLKHSPVLLQELRQFTTQYFSFGDFIFRVADRSEVGRASDLKSLEEQLRFVPEESIRYHAQRNHFSNWLKARTEFWLAHKLRPRQVAHFTSVEAMREDLIASLSAYRRLRQRGLMTVFAKESFDPKGGFARIGGGSLGGKARGLGFVNTLINNYHLHDRFPEFQLTVPPAVVLGTDVFDHFLDENKLRDFALNAADDTEITRRFVEARIFPGEILGDLAAFLDLVPTPLAVRSSSLLEDSQYHPFAGVYRTYMIPNNHANPFARLSQLVSAVKRVYASAFYQGAKDYMKAIFSRPEEEKMAVIVQQLVGSQHGNRYYPTISGVAKSYNFYPVDPQEPGDGIVSVALGLGKTIVEGGNCVRFCPKYPSHIFQLFSPSEALRNSQREFFALDLKAQASESFNTSDVLLRHYGLKAAEKDGSLQHVASTYSHENDALYDGLARNGSRIVSFAPILQNPILPLPKILELLIDMGSWGMGTPIEIEFAVNIPGIPAVPNEFGLLQIRPLIINQEAEQLDVDIENREGTICCSGQVLGHGVLQGIHDIVTVKNDTFDRSRSHAIAQEVGMLNAKLIAEGRRYVLIGVGRWGSLDPWLGIPVRWHQISGARAIVEASFKDRAIDPSQGSHFFHSITSFMIGYFTVNPAVENSYVDWNWLRDQPALEEKSFVRHIRLARPLTIKISGRHHRGVILKPE